MSEKDAFNKCATVYDQTRKAGITEDELAQGINDKTGLKNQERKRRMAMDTPKKVLVSRQFPKIGLELLEQQGFDLTL